ncbi:MAG: hypothetical protein K1X65_04780 [Caldilineales bacterium]|nr:hypothetical protein [Caldilineales bacterium]MCW5857890.1 hypothetical protein [Caldilineales bacterium]
MDSYFAISDKELESSEGRWWRPVSIVVLPARDDLIDLAELLAWVVVGVIVGYVGIRLRTSASALAPLGFLVSIAGIGGAAVNGVRVLYALLLMAWEAIVTFHRRIFYVWPKIVCTKCSAKSSLKRYIDGDGCKACHSTTAYCAACGKSMQLMRIYTWKGCPHCQKRVVQVYW